jgi:hypothetical protein
MPKPALLTKPSRLYVRFRIPKDLQLALGRGSVVRSLRGRRGDEARLAAAACGVVAVVISQHARKNQSRDPFADDVRYTGEEHKAGAHDSAALTCRWTTISAFLT